MAASAITSVEYVDTIRRDKTVPVTCNKMPLWCQSRERVKKTGKSIDSATRSGYTCISNSR
ncbi:hypothetical protein KSC_056940 [Ktedonobacter sp. SOSP1-52]|nr:hypothetical protein KSC_056940 [Ktedonobacter sp. SOSP1-52]